MTAKSKTFLLSFSSFGSFSYISMKIVRSSLLRNLWCNTNELVNVKQNYYMIGRDKNRTFWRVLKIDRTEPCELNIVEDPTTYSEQECYELLRRIHEGNKAVGGLKLITVCYGIIGTNCWMFQTYTIFFSSLHFGLKVLSYGSRLCEIFGTLLHAYYHSKTEARINLRPYNIWHFKEQDDSSAKFYSALKIALF